MTSLTDFLEHYKTFSNSELLHILENHDDFQPDAVRAAQMEWDSRQLTNEEVLEARQPILELKHKKETHLSNSISFERCIFWRLLIYPVGKKDPGIICSS